MGCRESSVSDASWIVPVFDARADATVDSRFAALSLPHPAAAVPIADAKTNARGPTDFMQSFDASDRRRRQGFRFMTIGGCARSRNFFSRTAA
jgi:hypothetical protein